MKNLNLLMLGVFIAIVGCVKQHPNRSSQGDEADASIGGLVAISSLKATYVVPTNNFVDVSPTSLERPELYYYNIDGSSYSAQTSGDVSASGMSIVNQVAVSDGVNNIRFLDKVSFETDAPLLTRNTDKVDFLGQPNTTYEIKYKLTPTALVMMKIVNKDEITHHERPYSDNLGNDKYAVPLGGYTLQTFKKKRSLNADRRKTNLYEYVTAVLKFNEDGSLNTSCGSCADYIRINPNDEGFQKFTPVADKRDVYPADYFTGEWYFSEGVVDTKPGNETSIGFISGSFDADFKNASKIKLFRYANTIKGYNIAVDEELSDDDALNLSPVISIPAVGKNYKLQDSGSGSQLTEVEIPNISIEEAPYVKIDFEGLSTIQTILESKFSLLGTMGTTSTGFLKEVMFSEKSFSLTFEDNTNGKRLRYSFLKAEPRGYQTRRHYKEDREVFGYFPTVRTRLRRPAEDFREEDFEKNILIQRHNPNKDVVFYFSDLTPKDNGGKCRTAGDDTLGEVLDSRGEINYREVGRRAVKYWDSAFKVAGAPKGVKLIEVDKKGVCFDAPLGDLQYNSINMLNTIQATNLLGVGPSLVDPYSGEVINTTMNLHIAPFRSIVSGEIREYMSSRLGIFKDRSGRLPSEITGGSTILGRSLDSFEGVRNKLVQMIPPQMRRYVAELYHFGVYDRNRDLNNLNLYGANNSNQIFDFYADYQDFNSTSREVEYVQLISDRILQTDQIVRGDSYSSGDIKNKQDYDSRLRLIEKYRPDFFRSRMTSENFSALASLNNMDVDIREKCPEVQNFVNLKLAQAAAAGTSPDIASSEDFPVIKSCMNKLIPDKILATVVHEMGHNLGLRHNFYGSADPKNFFTRDEIKTLYNVTVVSDFKLPKSSTVMEYIPSDKDRLYFPGHYDIAAIRYGYANQVEVDSADRPNLAKNIRDLTGNDKATDSGLEGSIPANVSATGPLRGYKYCTDHQAGDGLTDGLGFDPLCQRHDYGTNPKEVVDGLINDYYEHLVVYGTRFDRANPGNVYRRLDTMNRLKRFYDEWRYKLADHLGAGNEYLEKFDKAIYARKLAELKNDATFGAKEYLGVRDQIFKFFTDVAFLNNKYCVTFDKKTTQPILLELEKIRILIRSQSPDAIIANCEDSQGLVQKYIQSQGLDYIGDVGFSLNDFKFKVDGKEAYEDILDVSGTFNDRLYATVFLTMRSQRYAGLLQGIQPNMLDEPDFYEAFENMVLTRSLGGADLGPDLQRLAKAKPELGLNVPKQVLLNKYEAEGPFIGLMYNFLEQGINNPFVDSSQRATKYGKFIDNLSQDDIQSLQAEGGIAIPISSGRYLIIRKENEISMVLARAYSDLSRNAGMGFFYLDLVIPQKTDLIARTQPKFQDAISDLPDAVVDLTAEKYLEFAAEFERIFDFQKVDFFEIQLASMLTGNDFAAYNYYFKSLVDQINARVAAGVDASELQVQLASKMAEMNKDIPGFFNAMQTAIQNESKNPKFKLSIPLKAVLNQRFVQNSGQATDALFKDIDLTQRDFELNQEEYVAHFRTIQSILLGQGGAELGAQLLQSALTRSDISNGNFETPVQRFMERHFPDNYAQNMRLQDHFGQHLNSMHNRQNLIPSFRGRTQDISEGFGNGGPFVTPVVAPEGTPWIQSQF